MSNEITRRNVLQMAAGAATALAGSRWVFRATPEGRIVKAATNDGETFVPTILTRDELNQLAAVCEAIIPRTDTPGARDARVHEYIDVALSVESPDMQKRFRDGLAWLDDFCKKTIRNGLADASPADLERVLNAISDANETIPGDLRPGASFFSNVKTRTIFGFYTSREGWVEELGRPEHVGMEHWTGCPHPDGNH
jgi:hypothetical protein